MNKPRGRPFQPGNTYGKGRPKGSRNKFTLAAQRLLEEHCESLTRKCVIDAMRGDRQAMRLCMERVLPARRDAPVQTKLLRVKTAQDVAAAQQAILDGILRGQTTPSEGEMISNVVEKRRKAIETIELVQRVEELERGAEEQAKRAA
jgi:hypothetical protein